MFSKQLKDEKKATLRRLDPKVLNEVRIACGESDLDSFFDKIVKFSVHQNVDPTYVFDGLRSGKYECFLNVTSSSCYMPIPEKLIEIDNASKITYDSTELSAPFYYIIGHSFIDFGKPFCTHCIRYIDLVKAHDCLRDLTIKHFCSVCNYQTNDDDVFYTHVNSKEHNDRFQYLRNISQGDFLYVNNDGFYVLEPTKKRSFKIETKYIRTRLEAMDSSPYLMKGSEKLCSLIEKHFDTVAETTEDLEELLLVKMQMIALHSEINTGYQLCRKQPRYSSIYTIANCLEAVKYYLFRQIDKTNKPHYEKFQEISNMQDAFELYESDLLTCCSVCETTHKIKAYANAEKLTEVLNEIIEKL